MKPTEPGGGPGLLDDLLVKTSRTFALSIPRLPEPLRHEVTIAYLLFRIADTLEDATRWSTARQIEQLGRFAELLREPSAARARVLAADWLATPPLDHAGYLELLGATPALAEALAALEPRARGIVLDHTLRTVDCMADFVRRRGERERLVLVDLADLQAYCYAVAGIVGEMLTELFVLACRLDAFAQTLRRHAVPFGEALQLVNILKDAQTDSREGRSYLPASVDRAEVFALARRDLEGAGIYVSTLQRAGAPRGLVAFTALPVLLAWRTLERVEQDGPGSKLTREDVRRITDALEAALAEGRAAVGPGAARLDAPPP
jgi:farnesyl-diphosphate farnesyltransferase